MKNNLKNFKAMSEQKKGKTGVCPKIRVIVPPGTKCQDLCEYDAQCAAERKCCHNGCAKVCLPPEIGLKSLKNFL